MSIFDPSPGFEDRPRVFRSTGRGVAAAWAGLILMGLLFGGLIGVGAYNHRPIGFAVVVFMLPIIGQSLSLLYIRTVTVRIDDDTFVKSSAFGRTALPLAAMTAVHWSSGRNGLYLVVGAGGVVVNCSVSVFGKPQLDAVFDTLTLRFNQLKRPASPAAAAPAPLTTKSVLVMLAAMHGMGLLFLLMFVAMKSRFIVTPLGHMVTLGGGVVVGLLVAGWMVRLLSARPAPVGVERTQAQLWVMRGVVASILGGGAGLISTGLLGLIVCWGTDLAGTNGSMSFTVAGHSPGYRSCSTYELVEVHPMNAALCTSVQAMNRHPIGSRLLLTGRVSPLGIDPRPIDETNP